jgi:N4-gp56 family major capsid protein
MATTFKSDIIIPEVMGEAINAKIEAQAKITPYAKVDTTLQGVAGDTKTVPSWEYIGDAEDIAEGVEVGTVKLTAGTKTFTIKKAMKSVSISQEAINSGLGDPIAQAEAQLAKAISGKVDNDVLEEALKSPYIVDLSSEALSYKAIVNGVSKFEDEEDGVEKVIFINPKQADALLLDPMFTSADKFEGGVAVRGSIGKIAGCWVKKSKKVKAEGGTYLCPILKMEADSPETEYTEDELSAVTIFLKADTSIDHEWFPKKQIHDITVAKYYGVALTNESKVVLLKLAENAVAG